MAIAFEFDPDKSEANRKKHGIDFVEAQHLWETPTVELNSKNSEESRRLVIGLIDGIHWTGIITSRGENVRIISVRRSRDEEKKIYERDKL